MAGSTEKRTAEEASEEKVTEGSGNVFADLGLGDADERLYKAKIVAAISQALDARKLSQAKASEIVNVDQPTLSKLLRGRTSGFSLDRLIHMLILLDKEVEIVIRDSQRKPPHVVVSVAEML